MDAALPWVGLLVVSLAALLRSADGFLSGAEKIGLRLGLSPFVVGVAVVGFGTSLPELLAAVTSVVRGVSEIAIATAIGSNVTNLLLILGTAAVLGRGLRVESELVRVDLPFLFGSALLLAVVALDGGIGWIEGSLCLLALAVYLVYASSEGRVGTAELLAPDAQEAERQPGLGTWAGTVAALGVLQLSAWGAVESVVRISAVTGIGGDVLGATVVALGTSLPELAVTVRASLGGKPELAVGNVIGSNIFNALGVVGVAALFGTVAVPASLLAFSLPVMLAVTVLGFFVLQDRTMTRWDGALLGILYLTYTANLFGVA